MVNFLQILTTITPSSLPVRMKYSGRRLWDQSLINILEPCSCVIEISAWETAIQYIFLIQCRLCSSQWFWIKLPSFGDSGGQCLNQSVSGTYFLAELMPAHKPTVLNMIMALIYMLWINCLPLPRHRFALLQQPFCDSLVLSVHIPAVLHGARPLQWLRQAVHFLHPTLRAQAPDKGGQGPGPGWRDCYGHDPWRYVRKDHLELDI